jgi:hypothetical protein
MKNRAIERTGAVWLGFILFCAAPVAAGQSGKPAAENPAGQCLTEEQLEVNKKLVALDRPTKEGDADWIFDPDYFAGSWDLEWEVPESVLGSGGLLNGVLTFRRVDRCYYEGELSVKGPDRPYNQKIQFLADPQNRWMTWIETDSRGFTIIKSGRMGGDRGGYFTHHWDVPVFTYKGRKVRLRGTTFLGSPLTMRGRVQISVDDGAYENFGTQWFRKDPSGASTPQKR